MIIKSKNLVWLFCCCLSVIPIIMTCFLVIDKLSVNTFNFFSGLVFVVLVFTLTKTNFISEFIFNVFWNKVYLLCFFIVGLFSISVINRSIIQHSPPKLLRSLLAIHRLRARAYQYQLEMASPN